MKTTWIGRAAVRLCAGLALALAGCGGSGGESGATASATGAPGPGSVAKAEPRLIFITNGESDWWAAVEKGMIDAGARFGARVELKRNKEGTTERQMSLLEDAISQPDVKGVAVSVLESDSPGIADKMRDLQTAGKVVITIDSDGQPGTRRAYIGTNNRKAGEVAGRVALAIRPEGGKAALFVGTASAANARERREGFFAVAGKAFPEKQSEMFEDNLDTNRAQLNVQTALTKHPDAALLLGLYSYNGPRIAEELSKSPDLRKKLAVVTFDLDEQSVAHIENGGIDATVCQNPYEIGYQGVRLLRAFVADDKATIAAMLPAGATTIDTGVRVVVPSKDSPVKGDDVIDINEMKKWLASKGLKSS